ncbi:excalibur calcium-binding domain-containing protein [Arthrobacter sp. Soc17.1.1.1]|uniref:excalibur calcium-binding domain-containing protein n=1 Tax=Arthrobacter sp. Soc17.1.1.1 TaxID=3121277 RepID=UPI002FE4DF5A
MTSTAANAYIEPGATTTSNALFQELPYSGSAPAGYDRSLFTHWTDDDGDCQDTRQEVLIAESLTPVTLSSNGCSVISGQWYSTYDNQYWSNPSDVDIDHFVPLAEAYRSGASAWSPQQRQAFANDLSYSPTLVAMTDSLNQSKSDGDPNEWLPPVASTQCAYVQNWVAVKYRWGLSMDDFEARIIFSILSYNGCGDAAVTAPAQAIGFQAPQPDRYPLFKNSYDGTIYEQINGTPYPISYERWRDVYNFEAPQPTRTDYVKYPWSPTVYAVTFWTNEEASWQWTPITYNQYLTAGSPSPRIAGWIKGSYYYKWGTNAEIFVEGADGVNHKLTGPEWAASGYRSFVDRANEGVLKLSWAPELVWMNNISAGQGNALSYPRWQEEAFPTPQTVRRINGDQFYQNYGSTTIWYAGPGMNRPVSYNEWVGAGSPRPTMQGTPPAPPTTPQPPAPQPPPPTTPQPPAPQPPPPSNVYYPNCDAVRAAGKAPLYRGQPGYRPGLDREGDGIACE